MASDRSNVNCFSCRMDREPPSNRELTESVHRVGGWRVALDPEVALDGWLVVLPTRHVVRLDDLSDDEAAALGPLLRLCSRVLGEVVGSSKAYIAFFGEAQGFEHLHIHVVPRSPDMPSGLRGPRVFRLLNAEDREGHQSRDQLAARLSRAFQAATLRQPPAKPA